MQRAEPIPDPIRVRFDVPLFVVGGSTVAVVSVASGAPATP